MFVLFPLLFFIDFIRASGEHYQTSNGSILQVSLLCDAGALAGVAVTEYLCFSSGGRSLQRRRPSLKIEHTSPNP